MTKDKFGYNMPVDAPLYATPPIHYRNVEAIGITYETDEEAAMNILPEGLELPTPAVATILLIQYTENELGPYEEVILGLPCLLDGKARFYIPYIVVNTLAPLAAGREIWGYPKKMADINITSEEDMIIGTVERPEGNRIVTIGFRPGAEKEWEAPEEGGGLSLRVIPSPEGGTSWVQFDSQSPFDPWHKLCVKQILDAEMSIYDQVLGFGKVVKRY
ncbi:MAG: acetoacetate decarboxylase family protein [Deltaproteobacteria bacterium]|nr:acetoacetate decarboxylase family protein [Deltaproteobacteria bacterium]